MGERSCEETARRPLPGTGAPGGSRPETRGGAWAFRTGGQQLKAEGEEEAREKVRMLPAGLGAAEVSVAVSQERHTQAQQSEGARGAGAAFPTGLGV